LLETPEGEELTYGEARRSSGRLADSLARLGVTRGDRVAVHLPKSPLVILLYLACVRAGAVLVPLNPAYTDAEVDHLLGDADPKVVFADQDTLADALARGREDEPEAILGPSDLAAILYTSGTTGRPKGAMLTHGNLASNAATLSRLWAFGPEDVLVHALPVFHMHGLFVATNCVLASGARMLFLPKFDAGQVCEALPSGTVFMGVPTYYTRLLDVVSLDQSRVGHVRLFISGSAPLPPGVFDRFRERTGHAILERYGMTETSMISSNPLVGERRPGAVGRPLPGVEVRLAGDGDVGEIEVRGPNVFPGYWRQGERSDFSPDGFFRTGDLGRFDADGYLRIVGRTKDLVISGGLNVYPVEVEAALDAVDGVAESAVIGVPDSDLGEIVVAVVVADPGATLDPDALRQATRTHLAGFKVPRRVEVVDALPRNAMGKVEKAALRARYAPH